MKRNMIAFIILAILLINCSREGPADPTWHFDGYSGITYMDEEGNFIGPIDQTDWNMRTYDVPYNTPDFRSWNRSCGGFPGRYYNYPAFPNPSDSIFNILITMPVIRNITVVIKNSNRITIDSISFMSEYGCNNIVWDPTNNQKRRIPYGIYRVYYYIYGFIYGQGDVWYSNTSKGN